MENEHSDNSTHTPTSTSRRSFDGKYKHVLSSIRQEWFNLFIVHTHLSIDMKI